MNSTFKFEEIIDEFRLITQDTPKEYNFYQKIENASYTINLN